jgi:hypothetical protein
MEARVLVLCAALALAGCGADGEPQADQPPAVRETSEHFGFIRSVDTASDPVVIEFDEAEWLTGEAAQEAAQEDGAIAPGDPVPNDYYIRNPDQSTRPYELAPDAEVTATRCLLCRDGKPGNLTDFLRSFSKRGQTYADAYRGSDSQYWLTIEEQVVVGIDEQYRP